jgi:hypothetical protein
MRKSQKDFVIDELKINGKISRNYVLDLYHLKIRPSITKLATIISDLRLKEGWDIEPVVEKDSKGNNDMVYYVKKSPFKKIEYYIPDLGITKIIYEKDKKY